jgi:hypothetical protein
MSKNAEDLEVRAVELVRCLSDYADRQDEGEANDDEDEQIKAAWQFYQAADEFVEVWTQFKRSRTT